MAAEDGRLMDHGSSHRMLLKKGMKVCMKLWKQMLSLALVLVLVLGLCPGVVAASSGYLDVSENHWAYPYIQDVTERGIMNGVGSICFNPTAP